MIYARKKHGGASCYLVSPDMVQAFIRYETGTQGVANCFCNITVKPYKGRKYNPAFVWVCVRGLKGGESVYLILLLLLLPVQILIEILRLNK